MSQAKSFAIPKQSVWAAWIYFNSFSHALSGKAAKRIRERMRTWKIGRWTDAGIEDIAERVNLSVRGWWNYDASFYMSVFMKKVCPVSLSCEVLGVSVSGLL